MHSFRPVTRAFIFRWARAGLLPLVACSAYAAPVVDANVVNTPKVIDAENPARSAFAATLCFGNCDSAASAAMTVPAGKVAVIEYLSASCIGVDAPNFFIHTLWLTMPLKGAYFTHQFPVQTTGAVNGNKFYAASHAVRAYADATLAGTIQLNYSAVSGNTGPACNATLSGYLLNQ